MDWSWRPHVVEISVPLTDRSGIVALIQDRMHKAQLSINCRLYHAKVYLYGWTFCFEDGWLHEEMTDEEMET